ncbi:MAG: hypothetical protein HQM11_07630 [SAR324 cluster bacterium]|nr:hypothetical protein [SAR324 cluster bacterium]
MPVFLTTGEYGVTPYGDTYYGGSGGTPVKIIERITFLVFSELEAAKEADLAQFSFQTSSTYPGFFSNVRASHAGSGTVQVQGDYIAEDQKTIIVRIKSKGDASLPTYGKVGGARYYYSTDGGASYHTNGLEGYLTSSNPSDTPEYLRSLGVEISFSDAVTAGMDPFEVSDEFSFIGYRSYLPEHLLNWDKNMRWKANDTLAYIDVDFGSGSWMLNAFALHDHNLDQALGDKIIIKATNESQTSNGEPIPNAWGTVPLEVDIGAEIGFTKKHCAYLFRDGLQQYRYWRIELITHQAHPVKPEAGHIFLGKATQLSRDINKNYGFETRRYTEDTEFRTGQSFTSIHGLRKFYQAGFSNLTEADRNTIIDIWYACNQVGLPSRAFYTINLPSYPSDYLYSLFNQEKVSVDYIRRDRLQWQINLKEA